MLWQYHRVRMAHARRLLWMALRRWGLGLATVMALVAAASNAPVAVAAALLAALALPLWDASAALASAPAAATMGAWLGQVLAMGLLAALPVTLSRRIWWPRPWAEQERALPLPAPALRASDGRMALAWVSAPMALPTLGSGVLLASPTAAASPRALACVACGLLLAWAAAWGQAIGWMQAVRARARRAAGSARPARAADRAASHSALAWSRHWAWAVLATPLWRGVARGSARVLALATVATPALAAGPVAGPVWHGPALAALAALALACTAVLRHRRALEWQALRAALAPLPLAPALLSRALWGLGLWPALWALGWAAAAWMASGGRTWASAAYLLLLAVSCALEARDAGAAALAQQDAQAATASPDDPAARAAWRLLAFTLLAALAWESAPA